MTRIDFHSNATSRLDYVCRLVRKAYLSGHSIVLVCDPEYAKSLDEALWNNQPADFLPHGVIGSSEAEGAPIVLAGPADETPHHDVMINLQQTTPAYFSRFERLIEVIGEEGDAVSAGRQRWSFYRDRGYALTHHDANPRSA